MSRAQAIGLGVLGFALSVAYDPFIAGGAATPRWTVMALALIALPFLGRGRITWAHVAGLAFVGWALASLGWSQAWYDSHDALLKLLILAGMFLLGSRIEDMRTFWIGAGLGLLPSAAMIALEASGLVDILGIPRSPGLFVGHQFPAGMYGNGLFYAEAATLVAVALAVSRQWVLAAIVLGPLLLLGNIPRGPILALVVVGMAWSLIRGWRPGVMGCAAILSVAIAGATFIRPDTVHLRMDMWQDVIEACRLFG